MPEFFMIGAATVNKLLALPETGMGFQVIEDRENLTAFLGGEPDYWLVLSTALAVPLNDKKGVTQWLRSRAASTTGSLAAATKPVEFQTGTLMMQRILNERGPYATGIAEGALPTRSALVKDTTTPPGFKVHRFSASGKDPRVDPRSGDFLPGTYATTNTDRPLAPSGFAAVGRFALPNVQPASHVYTIEPAVGTRILIGTVGPAYGQSGGGVEVFFPVGAKSLGSFRGPERIPDE